MIIYVNRLNNDDAAIVESLPMFGAVHAQLNGAAAFILTNAIPYGYTKSKGVAGKRLARMQGKITAQPRPVGGYFLLENKSAM